MTGVVDQRIEDGWALYCGDNVEVVDGLPDDSVGLTVFSPPFPSMYVYTNSPRDMGNVSRIDEMVEHFRYLVSKPKLFRVTMPGRRVVIHLTQLLSHKRDGEQIGQIDFRGRVIQLMQDEGWTYYGEVVIDKDPQVKAIRTKDRGLLFKTLATDAAHMRMALPDHLIYFRKPGDNPQPIRAGVSKRYGNADGWVTNDDWISWAHPVWYDIRETNVLNVVQARETDDERHLCPLQLDVIDRAIKLWSNPGDVVLDPFAGIGSVPYEAVLLGRRGVGIELKPSYWTQAVRNLREASRKVQQPTLFNLDAPLPELTEVPA